MLHDAVTKVLDPCIEREVVLVKLAEEEAIHVGAETKVRLGVLDEEAVDELVELEPGGLAAEAGDAEQRGEAVGQQVEEGVVLGGHAQHEGKLHVASRRSEERRVGKECRSRWS